MFKKLGHPELGPTIFSYDNNSSILLANNPEFNARTEDIDTQVHRIQEILKAGQVGLEWIPGTEQLAEGPTKPLDHILFQSLVSKSEMK